MRRHIRYLSQQENYWVVGPVQRINVLADKAPYHSIDTSHLKKYMRTELYFKLANSSG